MTKIVNNDYGFIGSAISILLMVVFCFVIIYFMCMFLEKGEEMLPESIQYIYNNVFVKYFRADLDYLYDTGIIHLDDVKDDMEGKESPSSTEKSPETSTAKTEPTDLSECPTKLVKKGNQLMLLNENKPLVSGKNPIYFDNLDDYVYYMQVERTQTGNKCPILYLKDEEEKKQEEEKTEEKTEEKSEEKSEEDVRLASLDPSTVNSVSQYFKQQQPPQYLVNARQPLPNVPCQPYSTPLPMSAKIAMSDVPTMPLKPNQSPPMVPYVDANRQLNPNGIYGFDPSDQYVGKYTILDKIHDSTKTQYESGLSANAMDTNWGGSVYTSKKLHEGDYIGDQVESEKESSHTSPSVIPTPVDPTPISPTPVAPTPVAPPTPIAPTPVAPTPVAPTPVAPTPVAPKPIPLGTNESLH